MGADDTVQGEEGAWASGTSAATPGDWWWGTRTDAPAGWGASIAVCLCDHSNGALPGIYSPPPGGGGEVLSPRQLDRGSSQLPYLPGGGELSRGKVVAVIEAVVDF